MKQMLNIIQQVPNQSEDSQEEQITRDPLEDHQVRNTTSSNIEEEKEPSENPPYSPMNNSHSNVDVSISAGKMNGASHSQAN